MAGNSSQTLSSGLVITALYVENFNVIVKGRRGHGFSHQYAYMGDELSELTPRYTNTRWTRAN